jgi:hypothetical protein
MKKLLVIIHMLFLSSCGGDYSTKYDKFLHFKCYSGGKLILNEIAPMKTDRFGFYTGVDHSFIVKGSQCIVFAFDRK